MRSLLVCLAALAAGASATVYFQESFGEGWEDRWTVGSKWKSAAEMGEWKLAGGLADEDDTGLKTTEDARFYSISAPTDAEVNNKDGTLVVSYTVRFDQKIDCGGAYIKLLRPGFDPESFGGEDEYGIMFGPDVCGTSTRKTHVIFTYKGENLLTKKNIRCETDKLSHRYTLIVNADNTYDVQIDGKSVESGSLFDDWEFLEPKQIKDPESSKPEDWVDEAKIPDPEDVKPEGYDDVPASIPDPEAEMPEDWDEEEDGEWEPPMVDNPEYKGPWSPKMIDNPDYKGPWVHPMIDNPDYVEDDTVHAVCNPCNAVGFELWQVKAGTVFDDIIVTDSVEEADAFYEETFGAKQGPEKEAFDKAEEERKAKEEAERKAAEEARKAAEEAAEAEEEEEEHDEL